MATPQVRTSALSRTYELRKHSKQRVASLTALRMGCWTLRSVDFCYEIHTCMGDVQESFAFLVPRCVFLAMTMRMRWLLTDGLHDQKPAISALS
jgi:hypothetical protein